MTIAYPRTMPCGATGVEMDPGFVQAVNETLGRRTQVLERADPRWRAVITYDPMERPAFQALQAWLDTAEGALVQVLIHDPLKPYPLLYPRAALEALTRAGGGAFDGTAALSAIAPTSLTLTTLPAGFTLSAGDHVGLVEGRRYGLVRVAETASASAGGVLSIDVRPRGQTRLFTTAAQVRLVRPACLMTLDPGSVRMARTARRRSPISFSASQHLQ